MILDISNTVFFNAHNFWSLVIRFLFNTLVIGLLVRNLYSFSIKHRDFLFTYVLIAATIFLLCFLLDSVEMELSFALGLFAIFGILRYRTAAIPIKEMTYLFLVIGISIINALANEQISYAELLFTNFALISLTWILERVWMWRLEIRKTIVYDKINLIKPQNHLRLIADIEARTGIIIHRIEIGRIDFEKSTARIIVYYYKNKNIVNVSDEEEEDF